MQQAFEAALLALTGKKEGSFLLAVSGGVDSMVMASLFAASSGKELAIAHVNFGLRGSDSDADQALVQKWAAAAGIPCYVQKYDTLSFARLQKCSVEMAARMLRYTWFERLRQQVGAGYIAVAHHAQDHAETVVLNLVRGTGLRGLCGIPARRGNVIRPMLDFDRRQIEEYAQKMEVPFCRDATNALLDYSRNRIRHKVLPELAQINPNVVARLRENTTYLQQACGVLAELLEEKKRAWMQQDGDVIRMNIELISKEKYAEYWLFELLRPYGFDSGQMGQVTGLLGGRSGRRAASKSHLLYKDRAFLALLPRHPDEEEITCSVALYDASTYTLKKDPSIAALDAGKLHFPLSMRTWQRGDRFVPLGMSGFKKVSDFLIDAKVPLWEKERQQVLCSGNEVVWVAGRRIDGRYKITHDTKTVAEISCNK